MEMGRENSFLSHAAQAVGGHAAGQDHQIGQGAQGDGGVHVGQGGGQGDGVSLHRHRLDAQQLEQGAHEDERPGGENVGSHKPEAVGAAVFRHAVEQAHRLLQQELEPAGDHLEAGDGEHPDQDGGQQQHSRHQKGGDQPRVHVFQTEQTDLVHVMEHRVPHGLLHGFRPWVGAGQQCPGQQQQDN
jgi:hypothetical protein